jgi:hypothetical protein
MHHPGSKQQLEEVWEEQDHLSPDSFNPKTFFALHGKFLVLTNCCFFFFLFSNLNCSASLRFGWQRLLGS